MHVSKNIIFLLAILILLPIPYWQPWKIFTNSGAIFLLFCERVYESDSPWEIREKNVNLRNERKCKTPQLSATKLNYKVYPKKQKVVFRGKEIGILSYDCDVYDRLNFICPNQDISVENGNALLAFNSHETAVSKWRFWIIKSRLYLDKSLNRESTYTFE